VAFREVLPYLSLEPFRRCWYTQFLAALKESALPAPADPTEVGPDAAFRRAGNYILDLAHIPPDARD